MQQPSFPPAAPAGALSAVWRPGTDPPVLDVHRPDPAQALCVQVAGMENGLLVEPVHGSLAVHARPDGSREVRCPSCDNGDSLVNQEWVYSSRRVVEPTLLGIDDPDAGTLWFLLVSADSDDDGAYDVAGALAARFFCRSCQKGYSLPTDVHVDVQWEHEPTVASTPSNTAEPETILVP